MCEDAIEGAGNFVHGAVQRWPAAEIVLAVAPFVADWAHDFSKVDNDELSPPKTTLDTLVSKGYAKTEFAVAPENFNHVTFRDVLDHLSADSQDISNKRATLTAQWRQVSDAIRSATTTFSLRLDSLVNDPQHWNGETKGAALRNIRNSFHDPVEAGLGAGAMEALIDGFGRTTEFVHTSIKDNLGNYNNDLDHHRERKDEARRAYDSFAQEVMTKTYVPNIVATASNIPAFTQDGTPKLGDSPGGPQGAGTAGGGGGGPQTPDLVGPEMPEPTIPTEPVSPTTSPNLDGIADAASNALGQMGDAAKQAADAAKEALQNLETTGEGPPEGVLGLGPTGLGGAGPTAGGAGLKAGSGAGSSLPRGLPNARAISGTPTPAVARMATPAAGAGLGAMGAPAAGAPAAANPGADNNTKGHQVNKALKRTKNGQDVVGEADAIVPVIGADEAPEVTDPERSNPEWPKPMVEVPGPNPGPENSERPIQVVSQ